MAKSPFNTAQKDHLNGFLPEYIKKLDAGATTNELTKWKQATATKALGAAVFADLDFTQHSRTQWFEIIVRKYTNYYHQIYKKTHPTHPSASEIIKANPLLKFRSVPSGRQLFARDTHDDIMVAAKQHSLDKGTNAAGAYQWALKSAWDSLDSEEQLEWEAQAEDECGDVELNQKEFDKNMQLALRSLCQDGILGDAEMVLFYGFRSPNNGDLQVGALHGHSKHNKTNFGGHDLESTYGIPWAKFADLVIPRSVIDGSISITVSSDGVVVFPSIELDTIPPADLRHLIAEYFDQCWVQKDSEGSLVGPPWDKIVLEPASFYDTGKYSLPFPLRDPQTFTTFETLTIGDYLTATGSPGFEFKFGGKGQDSTPAPQLPPPPPPPINAQASFAAAPSAPPPLPPLVIPNPVEPPPKSLPPSPVTPSSDHSKSPSPPPPPQNRTSGRGKGKRTRGEGEKDQTGEQTELPAPGKKKAKTAPKLQDQPPSRRSTRKKGEPGERTGSNRPNVGKGNKLKPKPYVSG
ncbi:hypothetical protein B0H16DRAFT_1883519, partial [Mycena metata]